MVYIAQNIEIDRNLPLEEYRKEYLRVYRLQNKARIKAYDASRYQKELERTRSNKRSYIDYMGGECVMCGLMFNGLNAAVFDFHHVNPAEKEHGFGGTNPKLATVKKELDKCVLVCANCHRLLHAGVIELEKPIEEI